MTPRVSLPFGAFFFTAVERLVFSQMPRNPSVQPTRPAGEGSWGSAAVVVSMPAAARRPDVGQKHEEVIAL